jgi:hypothetical protein
MKLAIPFGFTRALPSCYAIHPEFFSPGIDMKKRAYFYAPIPIDWIWTPPHQHLFYIIS